MFRSCIALNASDDKGLKEIESEDFEGHLDQRDFCLLPSSKDLVILRCDNASFSNEGISAYSLQNWTSLAILPEQMTMKRTM